MTTLDRNGHFRYEPPLITSSIAIRWVVVWWEEQELIHSARSSIYLSLLFCDRKTLFSSPLSLSLVRVLCVNCEVNVPQQRREHIIAVIDLFRLSLSRI